MSSSAVGAAASDVRLVLEIAVITGCVAAVGVAVWLVTEVMHSASAVYRLAYAADSVMDDPD